MVDKDPTRSGSELSDEELIDKAKKAKNGERFELRFESEYDDPSLQERYDSRKQAEVALLANLAFWSGCDRQQMWRLFKESSQYRPELAKWPEYRRELLEEAISLVDDTYEHYT